MLLFKLDLSYSILLDIVIWVLVTAGILPFLSVIADGLTIWT
jgi:hypothetical protein